MWVLLSAASNVCVWCRYRHCMLYGVKTGLCRTLDCDKKVDTIMLTYPAQGRYSPYSWKRNIHVSWGISPVACHFTLTDNSCTQTYTTPRLVDHCHGHCHGPWHEGWVLVNSDLYRFIQFEQEKPIFLEHLISPRLLWRWMICVIPSVCLLLLCYPNFFLPYLHPILLKWHTTT